MSRMDSQSITRYLVSRDAEALRSGALGGETAPLRKASASRLTATLGWFVFACLLVAGLPLFLRMPLWIDVTLYDLATRAVLAGGTHYRDVFDTNPPGFVWALCLVRTVLGPSSEALRAADLAVVGIVMMMLFGWARAAGATPAGIAWAAAGAAAFYLYLSEFNHCQRDVWMMLPAVAAATYRRRRVRQAQQGAVTDGWLFRTAALEGVLWGLAAWIKPHIIVAAVTLWAMSQMRLAGLSWGKHSCLREGRTGLREGQTEWQTGMFAPRSFARTLRRSAADLAGSFAGGLLVGAVGLAWLVASGTWPYLYDIFTEWNTAYLSQILSEFGYRREVQLTYFPPWSLLFPAAVLLALLNVIDAHPWSAAPPARSLASLVPGWLYAAAADDQQRFDRGLLGALYLAWAAMAITLQKNYHYVHVPETLLMLALFAANRWLIVALVVGLQIGVMTWLSLAGTSVPRWEDRPAGVRYILWQYPDGDPNRIQWWPACFARDVSGQIRNGLAFQTDTHAGVNWKELEEVAAYLKTQGITAGDTRVMCWHDSPHPLYLMMNLHPPIRFMHLSTAVGMGSAAYDRVRNEVIAAAPGVRFVVSDLVRVAITFPPDIQARMREPGPDFLPPALPRRCREPFPMNQPAVFRSGDGRGRYVVHVITKPIGDIDVPGWPDDGNK